MSSISVIMSLMEQAKVGVDQNRCVRVRNKNATCHRCADACVTGCISYQDNELSIVPDKCIGCATCASACPTDALHPLEPTDDQLIAESIEVARHCDGRVAIVCQDMLNAADGLYDSKTVVAVPCLGRVDLSLPVQLAASGVRSIVLVKGACAQCQNKHGVEVCTRVMESANKLLETWNCPTLVRIADKLPRYTRLVKDVGYDQRKRAFFSHTKDEVKSTAATAAGYAVEDVLGIEDDQGHELMHVDAHGTLPHGPSVRRKRLLESLDLLEQRFGRPQDIMIDTQLASEVLIDVDVCRGCRMCATFCPTGANFKFKTKDGSLGVKHRVRDCVRCGLCRDICPDGALIYSEEVFAVDIADGVVERYVMKAREHDAFHDTMLEAVRGFAKDDGTYINPA
jgi:ferredoxin